MHKGERIMNWVINHMIGFLQIQKQRVESGQITASTLKNFIKSLKVFCNSADADASPYHFLQELQFFKVSENAVAPIC